MSRLSEKMKRLKEDDDSNYSASGVKQVEDSSSIANLPEGIDEKFVRFLTENPNPTDKQMHAWAEKEGLDIHKVEQGMYAIASIGANWLAGGRANKEGVTEDDVDPKELAMGIKVEAEHTLGDSDIAKFIQKRTSLDHFAEGGKAKAEARKYYTGLKTMEKQLGEEFPFKM